MKTIYNIAIILNVVLISVIFYSCASYNPTFLKGNTSITQLSNNVFGVTFKPDIYTESEYGYLENKIWYKERISDVLLLNSAKLAHNNGYDFFSIIEKNQYISHSTYYKPLETSSFTSPPNDLDMHLVGPPSMNAIVICYKEKPKDFSYNANFIIDSIQKKYAIK